MTNTISSQPAVQLASRLDYPTVAPAVLQAQLGLQDAVNRCDLDPRLLDLVKLRASQINGCAFCIDMHYRDALAAGESAERLYLLDAWRESSLYTSRERAALHWAEVLTRLSEGPVSDADFERVRAEFSESELAFLSLTIVAINGWNRLNVGFRMPPRYQFR